MKILSTFCHQKAKNLCFSPKFMAKLPNKKLISIPFYLLYFNVDFKILILSISASKGIPTFSKQIDNLLSIIATYILMTVTTYSTACFL